jgi:hypothetical protein
MIKTDGKWLANMLTCILTGNILYGLSSNNHSIEYILQVQI